MGKNTPHNFSEYERSGNNAIDIVAQAVGWAKANRRLLKSVTLSRQHYALFWAGVEILRQEPLPEQHILTFQGVEVIQGLATQLESITLQFMAPRSLALKKKEILN